MGAGETACRCVVLYCNVRCCLVCRTPFKQSYQELKIRDATQSIFDVAEKSSTALTDRRTTYCSATSPARMWRIAVSGWGAYCLSYRRAKAPTWLRASHDRSSDMIFSRGPRTLDHEERLLQRGRGGSFSTLSYRECMVTDDAFWCQSDNRVLLISPRKGSITAKQD